MNRKIFFYVIIISLLLLSSQIFSQQDLTPEQIYEKVNDAVVVIYAYDYSGELIKQGSGVVLNDKGYVVTNYHVLAGCERLEVIHGEEVIPYADIIGIDVEKDILILKIEERKFPSVKAGDIKKLKIGQRVYAIGSPLGLENTISEGIISGLRNYEELSKNYIQITASISSGSSGGAVVNDMGELIGISTLTAIEGQNLNFAIPINDVSSVEINSYSKSKEFKIFELFSKGLEEADQGNYEVSIKYFTSYIYEYPGDASAYVNRGNAKVYAGDYTGAIQDYFTVLELNPNDDEAYFNLGLLKMNIKAFQEAINYFDKAIKINPNYGEAFANRGTSKQYLGDYMGSIQDCNSAIEINPSDERPYIIRANSKWSLENYNEAIQDYNLAIEINPSNTLAYVQSGRIKSNLKDYKGAMQDFNKAIQINPNYAFAYDARGWLKYKLDDRYGACSDWSKAGELGDDDAYDIIREYCN